MPAFWTAARIANQVHRSALAASGFTRRGSVCRRSDAGLDRTLSVHTHTGSQPQVQLVVRVAVAGLPEPVTGQRHDSLSGTATTAEGRLWYPLPPADEHLTPGLLADASGPVRDFLVHAEDLPAYVLWAQEVFLGDGRPGCWGRFRPVLPQGTGPLQAGAFAAAALHDADLVAFLVARVENEEPDEHRFEDFLTEMRQLRPQTHPRHPIHRPARW